MTKILAFQSTFTNSSACTQLSLAVHPELSQYGNKLNTKLRRLYLSFSNMFPYPHCNDYYYLLLLLTRAKVFWLQRVHVSSLLLWPYKHIPSGDGLGTLLPTFSKENTLHRRYILLHDENKLSI